jgi:leucyl/phenylalanyl-tRNA--protein transferase
MPKLTAELLVSAYASGVFPMATNAKGDIRWFSPDPRAIIPLDEQFHIPHGLRRTLKKRLFEITFDQDFAGVIRACAAAHGSTWISGEIIDSYCELHRRGFAHSVEARVQGALVGGLYGVHLRGAFFGESMFHDVTDASKVSLVALVDRLRQREFLLLDTQWVTPHLARFGTLELSREDYLQRLGRAMERQCQFL